MTATPCRVCGTYATPEQRAVHRARVARDAARVYVHLARLNGRTPNPQIVARANEEATP